MRGSTCCGTIGTEAVSFVYKETPYFRVSTIGDFIVHHMRCSSCLAINHVILSINFPFSLDFIEIGQKTNRLFCPACSFSNLTGYYNKQCHLLLAKCVQCILYDI